MRGFEVGRPIKLEGMAYGPTNEQGVGFLFGRIAPQLGFHVECVRSDFPDCIATRHGKRYCIEFELRASSYRNHPARGADIIVCWDNDWENRPRAYRHLGIIDLKSEVGAGPRVCYVGCNEIERGHLPDQYANLHWSVPKKASVGDLIVMYRKGPSEIRDLWRIVGNFKESKEWGLQADIRLVVRLTKPLTYKELTRDAATRDLGFVRRRFIGKGDVTDDWPRLYSKITGLNPRAKTALRDFHGE
jgi:hypothetical protein